MKKQTFLPNETLKTPSTLTLLPDSIQQTHVFTAVPVQNEGNTEFTEGRVNKNGEVRLRVGLTARPLHAGAAGRRRRADKEEASALHKQQCRLPSIPVMSFL